MKTLETRMQQKHDFEINWINVETSFIPFKGELIIYDPEVDANGNVLSGAKNSSGKFPGDRTDAINYARIKIGDGIRSLANLPFLSGEGGFNEADEFVFYCGDATNLSNDPFTYADYIVACGTSTSVN